MDRGLVLLGVVAVLLACESRPPVGKPSPALPPEAPENVLDAELKQFLDGMLVTSNVEGPPVAVWPHAGGDGGMGYFAMLYADSYGIKRFEDLKGLLSVPIEETRLHDALVAAQAMNYPRVARIYEALWKKDPMDLEAAYSVGLEAYVLRGPKEALAAVGKVDRQSLLARRKGLTPADFEDRRCQYAFRAGRYLDARTYCNAAQALDDERGSMWLAKTFLVLGKYREALTTAELAVRSPWDSGFPNAYLTLGLAQQLTGQKDAARATWSVARARWPEYAPLARALAGDIKSELEADREELKAEHENDADQLSYCGFITAELGLSDQSEACYAAADRLFPGPALAHRLVFLARTDLALAGERLEEAVKRDPQPMLVSALANVRMRQGKNAEARVLAERVLAQRPNDAKAMGVMWEVCGNLHDYPCLIDYRKRLGMPTHFNVQQYRDASKAYRDQAEKNGEGLAVQDGSSASAPTPPPLRAISVVPLANRVPPELEGMEAQLGAVFPGLKVTIAPREETANLVKPGLDWVSWERLSERLREQPGVLYVIEEDLAVLERKYAFSQVDLARARGVASLSRLRSLGGSPTPPWRTPSASILPAIQSRVRHLLANGVGKLAGLSFPCGDRSCPMHERRSVNEFGVAPGPLCEKHQAELKARLALK